MEYKDYSSKVIAYIDILGFTNMCKNLTSEERFNRIKSIMEEFRQVEITIENHFDKDRLLNDVETTYFSDSLILSMPLKKGNNLIAFLNILNLFQLKMLLQYYVLRGVVCFGEIYHKTNVVFGDGWIEAYKKEKDTGYQPRIIIDDTLLKKIEESKDNREKYDEKILSTEIILSIDMDKKYYIDYLNKGINSFEELKSEKLRGLRERVLEITYEQIENYKENVKILQKYEWILEKLKK